MGGARRPGQGGAGTGQAASAESRPNRQPAHRRRPIVGPHPHRSGPRRAGSVSSGGFRTRARCSRTRWFAALMPGSVQASSASHPFMSRRMITALRPAGRGSMVSIWWSHSCRSPTTRWGPSSSHSRGACSSGRPRDPAQWRSARHAGQPAVPPAPGTGARAVQHNSDQPRGDAGTAEQTQRNARPAMRNAQPCIG